MQRTSVQCPDGSDDSCESRCLSFKTLPPLENTCFQFLAQYCPRPYATGNGLGLTPVAASYLESASRALNPVVGVMVLAVGAVVKLSPAYSVGEPTLGRKISSQ